MAESRGSGSADNDTGNDFWNGTENDTGNNPDDSPGKTGTTI